MSAKQEVGEEEEEQVAENHAYDADDDADLRHVALFDESGTVCQCIRRCTDRKSHGERCGDGDADEERGDAAKGSRLLPIAVPTAARIGTRREAVAVLLMKVDMSTQSTPAPMMVRNGDHVPNGMDSTMCCARPV